MDIEKKLKLTNIETYKKFINKIDTSKKKLVQFLKKIKKSGKKIHCYGASTKGNVLLQYYKLNNKIISYAADRNENKFLGITIRFIKSYFLFYFSKSFCLNFFNFFNHIV